MEFDRIEKNGTVTKASALERSLLTGVPLVFQLVEWILVIVAIEYIARKFDFAAARAASLVLTFLVTGYIAALSMNLRWRAGKEFSIAWYLIAYMGGRDRRSRAVRFGDRHARQSNDTSVTGRH